MKIQSKVFQATMFAAALFTATVSTQNAKADTENETANNGTATTVSANETDQQSNDTDLQRSNTIASASQQTSTENSSDESSTRSAATIDSSKKINPATDYYQYVNGQWISSAQVNVDKPIVGAGQQVQDQISADVQLKFQNYINGTEKTTDPNIQKAIEFYQLYQQKGYTNEQELNQMAFKEIVKQSNRINDLRDLNDLNNNMNEFLKDDITIPIGMKVDADSRNPQMNALYFYGFAPLYLDADGNSSNGYSNVQDVVGSILTNGGVSFDLVQAIITNSKKFDELLAKYQTKEDKQVDATQDGYAGAGINRVSNYLPQNYLKFTASSNYLDLDKFLENAVGMTPGYVYDMTPSYFEHLNDIINPDTFQLLKAWMISKFVYDNSGYIANLQKNFTEVKGESNADFTKRSGYYLTNQVFNNAFSKYFGDVLLDRETKSAVNIMAKNIVSAYKDEINQSSWIDQTTKKNALDKLENIKINIGYPSDSYNFYDHVRIKNAADIYQTIHEILAAKNYQQFLDYSKPYVRENWHDLSSLTASANYSAKNNTIYISTGIIQSPYFDKSHTDAQNYGGLGTIIGHELSHAFDQNGSLYDSQGMIGDMWSAPDFQTYTQKISKLVTALDQLTYRGHHLDGKTVLNESLADNSGIKVAQRALAELGNPNYDQFFRSYATICRDKIFFDTTPKSSQPSKMMDTLLSDPHAPFSVRVNFNLSNDDQYAKTYHLQAGDKMWVAPDQRFSLWN